MGMIDLASVIGVYPICNTGAVLVHKIDYGEEKVLASINGEGAEWCSLTEEYMKRVESLSWDLPWVSSSFRLRKS